MLPELTNAEKIALEATRLESFPVNLQEIRRTVEQLLSEFGRYGFFNEYTTHSYDHVHEMLACLDWLIPEGTKTLLTKGDWWLIALSCYFHDLGLVVTRAEFENREQSGFSAFCQQHLFEGSNGTDYRAKLDELVPAEREKILYQEFVRFNHAARVRAWVMGQPKPHLGQAQSLADEIDRLLSPLDSRVREDLANVCESHNLNDLANNQKYPVFQPYGRSEDETVNVQYAAVILRTVDLIQITKQRAPTVLYRIINPTDPVSQMEWLKQNAVRHLRPQPKRDRTGEVNDGLQSDTIEVYADFKKAEGFFGLTSYLQYAENELQASCSLIEKSRKDATRKLAFPWRYINDSNIRTEGFIPQRFEFKLDQSRILDLLTGHTLYNNSAIVVRELTQNALDAVRLRAFEDNEPSEKNGKVQITWDSQKSELAIWDNGTGMTQEIIENHLLKVGSSRYQDEKFKKEHPGFSPISRFGIGVLSSFMVADTVEILTCSVGEEDARQISLRSVHGKYLIRLIKKEDPEVASVFPHGTRVTLKLRATASKIDVQKEVQRWVVLPRCSVNVIVDGKEPSQAGYLSLKEALEQYLAKYAAILIGDNPYKVEERSDRGVTIAYALVFDPIFHSWNFAHLEDHIVRSLEEAPMVRTCVEGVAVEFQSPGFRDISGILALANITGEHAPKTNVARSSLENTPERREITRRVYGIYAAQIDEETKRLVSEEQFSLSRAMNEIAFLARPLLSAENPVADSDLMEEVFAELPVFLMENETGRQAASLGDLKRRGAFWCIVSPLNWSIEYLIREMPVPVTARQLFGLAKDHISKIPDEIIVSNLELSSMSLGIVEQQFDVRELRASEKDRRVDLKWVVKSHNEAWTSGKVVTERLERMNYRLFRSISGYFQEGREYYERSPQEFMFPIGEIAFQGLQDYGMVKVFGKAYLVSGHPITDYLMPLIRSNNTNELARCVIYLNIMQNLTTSTRTQVGQSILDHNFRQLRVRNWDEYVTDWNEFCGALTARSLRPFNPFVWSRGGKVGF